MRAPSATWLRLAALIALVLVLPVYQTYLEITHLRLHIALAQGELARLAAQSPVASSTPAAARGSNAHQCALRDMTSGQWDGAHFVPLCSFARPSLAAFVAGRNVSVVFVGDSNLDAMHAALRSMAENPQAPTSLLRGPTSGQHASASCRVLKRAEGRCTPVAYYGLGLSALPGNKCRKRCGCFTENVTCEFAASDGGALNIEYLSVERLADDEQGSRAGDEVMPTSQETVLRYLAHRRPTVVVFGQGLHSALHGNATWLRESGYEYVRGLLLLARQRLLNAKLVWHGVGSFADRRQPQAVPGILALVDVLNAQARKACEQQHVAFLDAFNVTAQRMDLSADGVHFRGQNGALYNTLLEAVVAWAANPVAFD